MTRRTVTLRQAIDAQFDQLARLVANLLVDNVNFETGYYFRQYPNTVDFVARVLPLHAEGIRERVAALKEVVGDNLDALDVEPVATGKLFCPHCGTPTVEPSLPIFYEDGTFDGKRYENEGNLDTHVCTTCNARFATGLGPAVDTVPASVPETIPDSVTVFHRGA